MTSILLTGAAVALALSMTAAQSVDPRRDLSLDESRGGHTLARHVGQTDLQLRERLRRERRISAASTYPDRVTAERVVAQVLRTSAERVRSWAARRGPRPNLALRVADVRGPPIGRVLERGARTAMPAHGAVVVLRWDVDDRSYFVLTSYPENRQ